MPTEEFRDGRLLLLKVGPLGQFANNAYLLADAETGDAVIVDAPEGSEQVVAAAQGLKVGSIILTHRHRDHWAGMDALLALVEAPVFCHEADREPVAAYVRQTLAHSQEMALGSIRLRFLHTPGHTPGSLCLLAGDHLLSGDTLFPGGPGRTQRPEDLRQEIESIVSRLYVLPDVTLVHPGHGASTTIGASRREYAVFAAKEHDPGLCGDVLWLRS